MHRTIEAIGDALDGLKVVALGTLPPIVSHRPAFLFCRKQKLIFIFTIIARCFKYNFCADMGRELDAHNDKLDALAADADRTRARMEALNARIERRL